MWWREQRSRIRTTSPTDAKKSNSIMCLQGSSARKSLGMTAPQRAAACWLLMLSAAAPS